jgi:predicted amidohydrolase
MKALKVAVWNSEVPNAGLLPGDLSKESLEKLAENEGESPVLVVLPPLSCRLALSSRSIGRLKVLEEQLAPWCELARKFGVSLIPGSFLVEKEGLWHVAPFIDQQGQITGYSRQTHLAPQERDQGWQAGRELPMVHTFMGQVAILLKQDCWQPEVWRLVTMAGADLVIALTIVTMPYAEARQLAGSWQNVQQNQVLGVECSFSGSWQGERCQGRNAYLAPCEMTPGFSGFLQGAAQGKWLVNRFNFKSLRQVRQEYPLLEQLNLVLYEDRLLPLYRHWQEAKR